MKLWTLQPVEVAERIAAGERFLCDPSIAECYNIDDAFREAYGWLVGEMEQLNPRPAGVELPIWAWYRIEGKSGKPDRRRSLFKGYDSSFAVLELEVPDELVTLSDFDSWHAVLNRIPILTDEQWEVEPYREYEAAELTESWKQIFEVASSDFVQACFWTIEPEYLVRIHRLRS